MHAAGDEKRSASCLVSLATMAWLSGMQERLQQQQPCGDVGEPYGSAPQLLVLAMGGHPAGRGVCSDRYRACRASRLQLPPSSATYMSWLPLIRV